MYCPSCGKEITASPESCPCCGKKLRTLTASAAGEPRQNRTSWFRRPNEIELADTTRADRNDFMELSGQTDFEVRIDKKDSSYFRESTDMSSKEMSTVDTEEYINRGADKGIVEESIPRPIKKEKYRRIEIIHARKRRKTICAAIVFAAAVSAMVLYLVLNRWAVDMPCDWCKKRPSAAFETSEGSKAYVCKECMKKCMICDKKRASRHYENYYGMIVFVCEDCYREMSQE